MNRIGRQSLLKLIEQHRETGSVPVETLKDFMRIDPCKFHRAGDERSTFNVVRHDLLDSMPICYLNETPLPWYRALTLWDQKTRKGLANVEAEENVYYTIDVIR
jgi:hypothetical protein